MTDLRNEKPTVREALSNLSLSRCIDPLPGDFDYSPMAEKPEPTDRERYADLLAVTTKPSVDEIIDEMLPVRPKKPGRRSADDLAHDALRDKLRELLVAGAKHRDDARIAIENLIGDKENLRSGLTFTTQENEQLQGELRRTKSDLSAARIQLSADLTQGQGILVVITQVIRLLGDEATALNVRRDDNQRNLVGAWNCKGFTFVYNTGTRILRVDGKAHGVKAMDFTTGTGCSGNGLSTKELLALNGFVSAADKKNQQPMRDSLPSRSVDEIFDEAAASKNAQQRVGSLLGSLLGMPVSVYDIPAGDLNTASGLSASYDELFGGKQSGLANYGGVKSSMQEGPSGYLRRGGIYREH